MMIATPDSMESFAKTLEAEVADAKVELTQFPSGGAMLDVRRSDGRLFVMAYTPTHGYGVDEVQAEDGFVTGYQFVFAELPPAAQKLRDLLSDSKNGAYPVALNLVVIHVADVEVARRFYACLGLDFLAEQHGRGPEHYAARIGSAVFELYPRRNGEARGGLRIGFELSSLDPVLEVLRLESAKIVTEPHASPWGRRAVAEDPDGNRVELLERR